MPELGGPDLADQLTLFRPGRADYPHLLLLPPPKVFHLPASLHTSMVRYAHIFEAQCTLIRGVIVIHPGLKYGLFHYTLVHFDHILSGVQISTIADFSSMHSAVVTFVHYYKFQVLHDFFHVIMVQFEIFGSW